MKERSVFLTKDQSLILRGIAIIMVIASHYVVWYMDLVTDEPIRYAVSRLGVYGVDMFFLVSGYGLAKSAKEKEVGLKFVWSRIKNTYVPYLLIAAAIEFLTENEWTLKGIWRLFTGYHYWFIRNILVFYLAFFLIFKLVRKNGLRSALLFAVLFGYSWRLMDIGRASFWSVSNLSFGIGVLFALYEKKLVKAAGSAYPLQLIFLGCLMLIAAKNGMDVRFTPIENCDKIVPGMAASTVWTLFCLQAGWLLPKRLGFLKLPGKLSLELYLLHQFLYNQIVNDSGISNRLLQGLTALVLTAVIAWLVNFGFSGLWAVLEKHGKTGTA